MPSPGLRGPREGTLIELDRKRARRWRSAFDQLRPGLPIEIEGYAGPVILSHCEGDEVWSYRQTERPEKRLVEAGRGLG